MMLTRLVLALAIALPQNFAPLPDQLIAAHKLYLINDSGDLKAFDVLYQELKKWGRFTIVTSRTEADAVAVFTSSAGFSLSAGAATASAPTSSVAVGIGGNMAMSFPMPPFYLKIFGAASAEPLWSDGLPGGYSGTGAAKRFTDNLKKRMPNK